MISNLITALADFFILFVCVWAVLNKRVPTGFAGTALLSIIGLFAWLSVLRAWWLGRPEPAWWAALNVAVAIAAALIYHLRKHPQNKERTR